MNGVQKRGLQAGYKCITLYTHLWLLLLIIIIIIIIIIIVFQLKQSAIIKQVLIGLACIAWARNYLITGCARETRKRERRPPPLFSPPPPPPHKTGTRYAGYDWPYSGTWRGRTKGAGDKGSFMLQWFFWFEDAQEQAPVQVPNHDKFFVAQTTLWPSLTLRLTYMHLDSCSLTIAHTLLPGESLESYLSRRMPVRWDAAESGAEVIGSWQNFL